MHILAISSGEGFELQRWRAVLTSGIDAFMIREKHLEARALLDLARRVQDLAPRMPLWINGRLDVALATGAGFHGPEGYPEVPGNLVPVSRPLHSPAQYPDRNRVDQLVLSPVLAVPGKGPAWGPEGLRAFLDGLPSQGPRLLALGGVTPETLPGLWHPRLHGIALIRALWGSGDPERIVARLRRAMPPQA